VLGFPVAARGVSIGEQVAASAEGSAGAVVVAG
jgi:hypothetical protein